MARVQADRADAVLALATTFRLHGYEGASLTAITAQTGLGKGSLYHFFPGGKEDMARAVLDEVGDWFRREVYGPLRADGPADQRLAAMFTAVETYFASRHLVCLFAAFALGQERDRFAEVITAYFSEWLDALEAATGDRELAADTVATLQGALILARALNDPAVFHATAARAHERLRS
ncbi:TetR/AcrR family transcriptional regulator [Kineosporia sp. NBRC 101731]|uniref:TetR/AcrR family transcriptional regulator n=1 Tax=Kineosporia sp. NBRC 101731 TaxID=3032199 RepID=UPI0024A5E8BA|nr:TetR/AcrR family transcriptional regulator [Kineosporia sp. NBRC 101731]GLY30497.1 TetR family transcriptional regulator [Kineosporia sp. NBRC 101731]